MFKYKSPLSRLLEGAGKTKEAEATDTAEATQTEPEAAPDEKPQPIADFNALRQALGGGSLNTEGFEESDELLPEDKMPEFDDEEEPVTEAAKEAPSQPEAAEPEPVVTLRLAQPEPEPETASIEADSAEEAVAEAPEPETSALEESPEPPVAAPEPATIAATATAAMTAAPDVAQQDRRARVKTTFLGFERPDTHVQDLIETAEPIRKAETAAETFPVGWLVVTGGPGRGASITLKEGLMQIGRNDDQAIQLDFGDTGISRSNHAFIAYDPEDRKCYLGHGGKANLVRLNGKPVLSTVPLASGDLIRISETSLRFVAFCDENFDWRDA